MPSEEWILPGDVAWDVERAGIRCHVPTGWDCRIGQRWEQIEGERAFPFVHAATRPLSGQRADYGGGVVESLGRNDVFIALIEFGPEEAGSALFHEVSELPTLEVSGFHRNQLQRRIRGQAGVQHFITLNGRAFCLYVVLGSIANAADLVDAANRMLLGIFVEPV